MFMLTKSECATPEDICTQHPFMASLKKLQSIRSIGSSKEKTSMWGMKDNGNANIQKINFLI